MNLSAVSTAELKATLSRVETEPSPASWLLDALRKEIATREKVGRRDSGDGEGHGEKAKRYGG